MFVKNTLKFLLTQFFGLAVFYYFQTKIYKLLGISYIVCVTYHDTPEKFNHNFQRHLRWYGKYFVNCNKSDLRLFIEKGEWKSNKPGIIISFDDGLLSNLLYAKQELEAFGFTGWFMVPAGVIDLASTEHLKFAINGLIDYTPLENSERLFMNRDEIVKLRNSNHEIVCHSYSHSRLSKDLSDKKLESEIIVSTQTISQTIGEEVDSFAWVGGEEFAYNKRAIEMMKENGIDFVFATNCSEITPQQNPLMLERFHVDASYSLRKLSFSISWPYKLLYRSKRKRLKQLLFGQNSVNNFKV